MIRMITRRMLWLPIAIAMVGLGSMGKSLSGAGDDGGPIGIPPETVADYVHAVIEADRTVYTTHVVERMQINGIVVASEDWEQRKTLPLPAQFLREASKLMAERRSGLRYRLVSLWPINVRNGPATDFERKGLEEVVTHFERPYTGIITNDRGRFFQAVYADRAVSQTCIGCHNAHPDSPKRDFKLNDVMGAIVITIPLRH
jgi:hypothetical protein